MRNWVEVELLIAWSGKGGGHFGATVLSSLFSFLVGKSFHLGPKFFAAHFCQLITWSYWERGWMVCIDAFVWHLAITFVVVLLTDRPDPSSCSVQPYLEYDRHNFEPNWCEFFAIKRINSEISNVVQ